MHKVSSRKNQEIGMVREFTNEALFIGHASARVVAMVPHLIKDTAGDIWSNQKDRPLKAAAAIGYTLGDDTVYAGIESRIGNIEIDAIPDRLKSFVIIGTGATLLARYFGNSAIKDRIKNGAQRVQKTGHKAVRATLASAYALSTPFAVEANYKRDEAPTGRMLNAMSATYGFLGAGAAYAGADILSDVTGMGKWSSVGLVVGGILTSRYLSDASAEVFKPQDTKLIENNIPELGVAA
jgi:hypothetical protein